MGYGRKVCAVIQTEIFWNISVLKTNTSKKIVQTRHQSGLDVLKSLAPAILLSYSKSVVSIVLIIALIRLSSKIMILKIEGKAYRTATFDG